MKKALVVGINNYPQDPLKGCINDASAFANTIEKNGDGSPNFDARLLTDITTKSELMTAIVDLFNGESDIALLYFSGHGFLDAKGGCLVTPDHQQNDEGVSMDTILKLAKMKTDTPGKFEGYFILKREISFLEEYLKSYN